MKMILDKKMNIAAFLSMFQYYDYLDTRFSFRADFWDHLLVQFQFSGTEFQFLNVDQKGNRFEIFVNI